MDIVEFVERFFDVKLNEWQKNHIRMLEETRRDADIRVIMPRHNGRSQVYIYMNQKELIPNGTTNDHK